MKLRLQENKTISELKGDFTKMFPHLKLECYYHSHNEGEGSGEADLVDENKTLGEIRSVKADGTFEFDNSVRITDFEDLLRDDFGLNIQVFRKSGDLWLETTISDHWTLEKQEDIGTEMDN